MIKTCLTEKEAATYIGMSCAYLRQDRMNGTYGKRTPGPAFIKLGRSIRYKINDLDTWLDAHRVKRESV